MILKHFDHSQKVLSRHVLRQLSSHERLRRKVLVKMADRRRFNVSVPRFGQPVEGPLQHSIPNYEQLAKATPDDLVLLSFSSHGYADQGGEFFLLPYDVRNAANGDERRPDLQSCISSDELSLWLRDVDAGEMVMIVDACHAGGNSARQ
jgi:hypothetical protein